MRHAVCALIFLATAQTLLGQEALNAGLPRLPEPSNETAPSSAWLDLRQTTKASATQTAPDWVESVKLIPQDQTVDIGKPTIFRIRVHKPSDASDVLFVRLLFFDKPDGQPQVVAWDESGSQVLRSGPLGSGLDLESSEAVMVPMQGVSCLDIEAPGDGRLMRGVYIEWMRSSEVAHSAGDNSQQLMPEPFSTATPLTVPTRDAEEFGTVTAPLSTEPIRIGAQTDQAALYNFGLESQPLLALITFEIAAPRVDSPPELIVNGRNFGAVSLFLPKLADPAYRGEVRTLMNEMHFQYTGWVRAQSLVPASSLRAGSNQIAIVNGPNASASVIRGTQIELKYLWDKSDYILRPER
jgi:hypothetical protein